MADDTQANQVAETQPEPMPSSEQTTSEAPGVEEAVQVEGTEPSVSEDVLPEGTKARTAEQFDKLKQRGEQQNARIAELENYIYQLGTMQQQQPKEPDPLYDPATGGIYVDQLEAMRNRTTKAEQTAQQAQKQLEEFLIKQQETEAFAEYPELNPKSKDFNTELHKATRALVTDSMINPRDYGGSELTLKQAADLANSLNAKKLEEVKEVVKQETLEELTPKEQASLSAESRSDQAPMDRLPELQDRTRRNDINAIVERLKGIPTV